MKKERGLAFSWGGVGSWGKERWFQECASRERSRQVELSVWGAWDAWRGRSSARYCGGARLLDSGRRERKGVARLPCMREIHWRARCNWEHWAGFLHCKAQPRSESGRVVRRSATSSRCQGVVAKPGAWLRFWLSFGGPKSNQIYAWLLGGALTFYLGPRRAPSGTRRGASCRGRIARRPALPRRGEIVRSWEGRWR